ncbi:hypothetical protein K501DRAFT_208827 [Backusella circina FSU 941]|nr:hypothetical protein K501DRAFT_208827 [Backusella circina FSU 941]
MSIKKLQTEIDRHLKKVAEGVETFETIFDKIHTTQNANQKDKYELDLKKEIKKLQRLRDQIKTWLSSNDIKDKRQLMDNRKLIETQMERFKQIEREMKTKAYSREGLMLKEKLDPKDQEKVETCEFITSMVDELSRQIEKTEFEIENLSSTTSRKGKKDAQRLERMSEFERLNERKNWHINRLELVLRLLENDHLEPESVNELKDTIQYYVESNQEPDFEEVEDMYDDLNLEEEEKLFAIRSEYHQDNKSDTQSDKEEDEEEIFSNLSSPIQSPGKSSDKGSQSSNGDDKANLQASVTEQDQPTPIVKAVSRTEPSSSIPSTPTTLKYAQAAASSSNNSSNHLLKSDDKVVSAWNEPPKIVDQSKLHEDAKQHTAMPLSSPSSSDLTNTILPASLADLAPSFESVKTKGLHKDDVQYTNQMLDASLQHVPDLIDSERPKVYQPRNPYNTPSYYPQQPLAIFDNPILFDKFDMDTLFYIFYYQQGTYQQYLAAKELKKQSWRFHKKYLTWFQRHEEPKKITDDYEQGTYIYFDYEGAWCQRKKTEFRFEYRFLEES